MIPLIENLNIYIVADYPARYISFVEDLVKSKDVLKNWGYQPHEFFVHTYKLKDFAENTAKDERCCVVFIGTDCKPTPPVYRAFLARKNVDMFLGTLWVQPFDYAKRTVIISKTFTLKTVFE